MGIKWLKLKIKCTKFEKIIYSYTTQQQEGGGGSDWLNATRNKKDRVIIIQMNINFGGNLSFSAPLSSV